VIEGSLVSIVVSSDSLSSPESVVVLNSHVSDEEQLSVVCSVSMIVSVETFNIEEVSSITDS
jgi:hypothetical protein